MGLFDVFKDTIFLKEDSDLEKQLNDLKSIRDKVSNKDEIEKDIKLLEYGIQGEKDIAFELKNANLGLYVLHDVTFEIDGLKAQIDYLIFSKGYYYIVECKNLFGDITVDAQGQFTRCFEYNGKKNKESIYSPLTQASRHRDIMRKLWSSKRSKLSNFLFRNDDNWAFKPIVVLSNSKCILNTQDAPKEIKNNILRADQLVSYIKNDIKNYDKDSLSYNKWMKDAAESWLRVSVENKTNIADKYKDKIETVNKKELEIKLKEFRKQRSKEMNMPAYYIFTDSELEELLENLPKTIDELRKSKILTEIKIKCHGEAIINVINENR